MREIYASKKLYKKQIYYVLHEITYMHIVQN